MERFIRNSFRSTCRVASTYSSTGCLVRSNRPEFLLSHDNKLFHNSSKNHGSAKNLARDTRMAGRRRFFKTVDVLATSPPWETVQYSTDSQELIDNPISAGVDGSNSATNISLEKPTMSSMQKFLSPSISSLTTQWYGVTLDGRLLKTPMGTTLSVPSLPLALAIASEWDDQGMYIKPAQMPLMTLVCTTLDQLTIPSVRERTIEDLLRYLRNDTTCYWADATEDRVLHRKQQKHWQDLHNWIDCEIRGLGMKPAIAMGAGEGLVMSRMRASKQFAGLPHSEEMIDNARTFLNGCDSWKLATMQTVTMEAKSFLVGMAIVRGVEGWIDSTRETRHKGKPNPFSHDTKKAVLASRVEEEFQIDNWGLVEGGHDYDRLNCSIQIHAATSLIQS
eukprot:CAMPEP_0176497920 /NCGR_PEP_ID=MMETSP0200_2-20121128/12010_1 /TAXON_ID=947934 /ORGANISM="Chaetoceros sp., Strain GSL56" /LENGTH=390 /DNA_ID=CAMNT_0017896023 /DNA_START=32 /DNA_END=1200 /DNA_ORIENTATION=+